MDLQKTRSKSNVEIFISCFIVLNETDAMPIATLSYANGPGFVNNIDANGNRVDLAEVEFRKWTELNLELKMKLKDFCLLCFYCR